MSGVEISQKKQTDSNNQKLDGKSGTESLNGILKEDDLDGDIRCQAPMLAI